MITQELVKELFNYDYNSGVITRRISRNSRHKVGDIVGSLQKKGYIHIKIDGKVYQAHRIAWLYTYGQLPEFVDHINHVRSDNRLINLREVTKKENCKNQSLRELNTSGVCGVYFDKSANRWKTQIVVDGKFIFLGRFTEFSEAVNARKNAEVLYGFHENHGKDK